MHDNIDEISTRTTKQKLNKIANFNWQRRWDACTVGRHTYKYLPEVCEISKGTNQLGADTIRCITGKGEFKQYYKARGWVEDDICEADGEIDTAEHALWHCQMHKQEREAFLEKIGGAGGGVLIKKFNKQFQEYCTSIIIIRKVLLNRDDQRRGIL